MHDPIEVSLRRKKDSSMRIAISLVKPDATGTSVAQACVSAGNTGALMALSRYVLKTLEGIDRPGHRLGDAPTSAMATPRCLTWVPTSTARPSICCSSR